MMHFLQNNLLFTQGIQIFVVLIALGIGAFLLYRPLLYVVLGALLFSLYFFRNPDRVCSAARNDDSVLICPADGKILAIARDKQGGIEGYHQKVSIFMSPFDVHVNWLPTGGTIENVAYKPGKFMMAFLPKSSELNERNDVVIRAHNGSRLVVRQISGTIARCICCWINKGDTFSAGHKYGMIRFGSRVDILLPDDVTLDIGVGQRVYGGQTVLGRWTCA